MKKLASGTVTLYHYDYAGNLIAETDGNGTPLRDYVYLNGERTAMKVYGSQAGWYYFVNDHLGTPQKIVSASGEVVWEAAYLSFGEAQVITEIVENNFRFPGQYFDAETGLHYNWNRYYDPQTGRYLTPDPIGLEGGMNLYVYCLDNPIKWTDPRGLESLGERIGKQVQWYIYAGGLRGGTGKIVTFDFPNPSPDAYGIAVSASWINPVTGDRGGGDVVGLNRMFFINDPQWYDYGYDSLDPDFGGAGLDIGISAEGVYAWGTGPWSGLFTSINLGIGPIVGSVFWSPDLGWIGVTYGLTLSPVPIGAATEKTNYFSLSDNEAFCDK